MIRTPAESFTRSQWLVLLALGLLTLVSFWPVGRCGFVDIDDHGYVAGNGYVKGGLTIDGIVWAFNGFHAGHWIPLTWLSLMTDAHLFGAQPAGFHWTNLILHVANVLLLYLVMRRATGSIWRSALVSALFGVHPLRVESVAWITERKDVLAAFFGLLALLVYLQYTRSASKWRYASILALFALSLMAKPMLVALPLVMLLLDYWPLSRLKLPTGLYEEPPGHSGPTGTRRSLGSLILEKAPLFLLAAGGSVVASIAQGRTAAASLEAYGIADRLSNATVSYVRYLWKLISVHHLAVFYPVHALPGWLVIVDASLLAVASTLVLSRWKRAPWLLVGWLWFMLTMLPMIGLVQIGQQAMADRFSYFPTIGVLVMIVWSLPTALMKTRFRRMASCGAAAAVILALSLSTWRQTTYWKDSATLFQHAVDVTDDNYMAFSYLGATFAMQKNFDGALRNLLTATRINPRYNFAQNNLGSVLAEMGRNEEAMAQFELSLRINPKSDNAHFNLGYLLSRTGHPDQAIGHFRQALEVNPDHVLARYRLGVELQRQGKPAAAIEHLEQALMMSPDTAEIHYNLGMAYEAQGRLDKATSEYERTLRLAPRFADACIALGALLARTGETDRAIGYFKQALEIRPSDTGARDRLETVLARKKQSSAVR